MFKISHVCSGDAALAKELSAKGQHQSLLMKQSHEKAAIQLFIERNSRENMAKGKCIKSCC